MHRTLRVQDVAQGAQADVRIRQMMQHACADDLIEHAPEFPSLLDRKLVEFEILQTILCLKFACVAQTRLADVDGRDTGVGLAKRVPGRL